MNTEIPQFGIKQPEIEYVPRPGVYAIVTREDGCIAVAKVKNRYFLLGGALDKGEKEKDGLRREIMEEAGKEVRSATFLGQANQYIDASDGHFNKVGIFYKVELIYNIDNKSDPTHEFCWVTKEEFCSRAAHEDQVYAVNNFLDLEDNH